MCEVGGIYQVARSAYQGGFQKVPGRAKSGMQIAQEYPGFDTSRLPQGTPWDDNVGFEETSVAVQRAARVASWLRMPELHDEIGDDGILILVSHADFLALLMANLCNVKFLDVNNNPDADVSAHGISESTLNDEIQHKAASVYQKFRISLACTTLIDLKRDGSLSMVWMNKKSHLQDKGCCIA